VRLGSIEGTQLRDYAVVRSGARRVFWTVMKKNLLFSGLATCGMVLVASMAWGQAGTGAGPADRPLGTPPSNAASPQNGYVPPPGRGEMQSQPNPNIQNQATPGSSITNAPSPRLDAMQGQQNPTLNSRQAGGGNAQPADQNDPDRWRFSLYNGEWWYWMPGNYWMFYRDNSWRRYEADTFQPYQNTVGGNRDRYVTGYRGVGPEETSTFYFDEQGRRYRRDYSPDRRSLQNSKVTPEMSREGSRIGGTIGGATGGDTTGARIGAEIGGAGANR